MIFAVIFWLTLAVIVGVAANTRGRSPVGWFFLAVVFSPLLAGLLVLALPHLTDDQFEFDDGALRRNVTAAQKAERE